MTSTQNTFEKMVHDFKVARYAFGTSRLGSAKGNKAEAKMEALVAKAEAEGFLAEFVTTVNSSTYSV
jgi:hypothetical protein